MFLHLLCFRRRPQRTPSRGCSRLSVEQLETRCQPSALTYASYFGGDTSDGVQAVTTDAAGDIYLAGRLNDGVFPFPGRPQTVPSPFDQGYVAKFDPTGTTLLWTTLLECSTDGIRGLAVDAAGNAYVTGDISIGIPGFATSGAAQTTFGGNGDAFAAKLNGATGALVWRTYLGGSQLDHAQAIAVNPQGLAIVTGYTTSADFPTKNALTGQAALHPNSGEDAFVTAIRTDGTDFVFSTYLGGNTNGPGDGVGATVSNGNAIALDAAGNIYLTGYTEAADFPTTPTAYQATKGYAQDVFITELKADFSQVLYSTFLSGPGQGVGSGNGEDIGYGIAVDGQGNILVTGSTTSLHFPTKNAFSSRLGRGSPASPDAFVTKLNPTRIGAAQLVYSTYDGGSSIDFGQAITVDPAGNAYVAGFSDSDTHLGKFPVVNPFQRYQEAGSAFIAKFSPTGHVLINSKFGRSGSGYDGNVPLGAVITATPFGRVIFGGDSGASAPHPLPITANAFQPAMGASASDSGYFAMLAGTPVRSYSGVDADGDHYTVSLSGPGGMNVLPSATGALDQIIVQNTNPAYSVLTIRVTQTVGDGFVAVNSITGSGLLRISAGTADLVGSGIQLTGKLGALTIHDVTGGVVHAQDLLTQATSITAHDIGNGVDINVGSKLSLLRAADVGTATIEATRLGTLSISGDFAGQVALSGTGTVLTTATITGTFEDAKITAALGNIGSFKAGSFVASNLTATAGSIGTVTLATVTTDNGGTAFGITAHTWIQRVTVGPRTHPVFTYVRGQPTPRSSGDFTVKLV